MRNIATIFKREIKAYFNSGIAYIFIIVFLLISVGLFMTQFFLAGAADMRGFFYILPIVLCVFLPAVTMRLWAEDRKGNTLELLLTFPVETYELVLGKFFASLAFYAAALACTLTVPLMLLFLGRPDSGVIFCQYLGAVLLGSFFLSLGILISGFCRDQIVSFIVSMMACFVFFLLGAEITVVSIDGWVPGLGSFLRASLGMIQHFDSFQKGIIDTRAALYFLMGSVIFLLLNGFWLETRFKPGAKTFFTGAALISLGIFVLVNFIFTDFAVGRFDTTQGKIYTISKSTAKILQQLEAPVTVKVFISPPDKMPSAAKTLERDIRDKLDEFRIAAPGRFNYKVFHMEAANISKEDENSLERSIEKKGIRPFQVRSIEADEVGVRLIYSAISVAYKEKDEEIIPHITPDNILDLEYTLISMIYKMTLKEQPRVALVAPYEEKTVDPQMQEVLKQLGRQEADKFREDNYELISSLLEYEGYRVSRVKLTADEPIPQDCDTLIIIEPREFSPRQLFEINRFLVEGGSVFLAVQNYEYQYSPVGTTGVNINPRDKLPGVNELLSGWGLGVSKDFLMDTQTQIISLTGGGKLFGIFSVSSPVKFPVQIVVSAEQMNKDVSITSLLPAIFYLWGTALDLDKKKLGDLGLAAQILFSSSRESWQSPYHGGLLSKEDFTPPVEGKIYPLAVLVEGSFPDTFADKEVPAWPLAEATDQSYEKPQEEINLSPAPGKLVLTGCAEMFKKEVLEKGGQRDFFINAVDAITLGEDLIKVRSKQPINRSLKKTSSSARAWWRVFTTFLVPVILCGVGALRIIMRRRSKWAYLRNI